uniref:Small ribosomal subunit protein uS3c n=1 Tax=Pelargonium tetragonum TaxID=122197 RepID=A0A1B0PU97_9ROSI|nr:ribosomal protein S3 [Pelargonium tetragonum]YP_009300072.1 ribosomal protein S3 [Pelargonium tetragonum]AJB99955.1 ribosomal protein S3 [Pelargonium tetragonum]AJB99987.1 ribosomal protein S3 [Pelargonium tetragonum]QBW99243.1 ribosomal protein S3 [Pelargonium tetragonum]
MGQKINPLGFRLGTTQTHHSIWFEERKDYSEGLQEDHKIREHIKSYIEKERISSVTDVISRIHIDKSIDLVKVIIYMGFSQLLTEDEPPTTKIKELQVSLKKAIHFIQNRKLNLAVRKMKNPYGDPTILGEFIADQLKKRVSFRKVMKKAVELVEKASKKGIQVQIAGCIGGKAQEMARVEWLRKGRVPLQTVTAKIDFGSTQVLTIHGVLGIKVWIF